MKSNYMMGAEVWLMSWEFLKDTLIRSFVSLMRNWRNPALLLWQGKFPEHFGKRSSYSSIEV